MCGATSNVQSMSTTIPLLSEADMPAELAARLRPRVARLGYLGEFFRYTAHQPKALMAFLELTETLKESLPDNLTEVVALSVARLMDNAYERVQHERLTLKLGFGEEWLRAVLSLSSESNSVLSKEESLVQRLVIAVVSKKGKHCGVELEALVAASTPKIAIAVLMLIGRYMTHALIVNTLQLVPPVPSPLEEK